MKNLLSKNGLVFLLSLSLSLTGGFSCFGGSGGEGNIGGSDLSPNPGGNFVEPEDIFDDPRPLPDSFLLTACPDPILSNFDINFTITSDDRDGNGLPDVPFHDFNGDGQMDSILLVQDDPDPKTLIFEGRKLDLTSLDPNNINFDGGISIFVGGYEFDQDGTCQASPNGNLEQSFAFDMISGSWHIPPFDDPLFQQWFIPGTFSSVPDPPPPPFATPDFSCGGFEGPAGLCLFPPPLPPISAPAGILRDQPGVHVVATRFVALPNTVHCTKKAWRIIVCPMACHCKADGTPIPFDPNCNPLPNDSPCK